MVKEDNSTRWCWLKRSKIGDDDDGNDGDCMEVLTDGE